MKINGIRGLISLKVLLDEDELEFVHALETEECLFSYIKEKVVNFFGPGLVDNLLIWQETDGVRVIIKVGEDPPALNDSAVELVSESVCLSYGKTQIPL